MRLLKVCLAVLLLVSILLPASYAQVGIKGAFYAMTEENLSRIILLQSLNEEKYQSGKVDFNKYCFVDSVCQRKVFQIFSAIDEFRLKNGINDTTFNSLIKLGSEVLTRDTFISAPILNTAKSDFVKMRNRTFVCDIHNKQISIKRLEGRAGIIRSILSCMRRERIHRADSIAIILKLDVYSSYFKGRDKQYNEAMCQDYALWYNSWFANAVLGRLKREYPNVSYIVRIDPVCRPIQTNISKLYLIRKD